MASGSSVKSLRILYSQSISLNIKTHCKGCCIVNIDAMILLGSFCVAQENLHYAQIARYPANLWCFQTPHKKCHGFDMML